MEVESLGPIVRLEPDETVEHKERWHLFRGVEAGDSDEALEAAIMPLVGRTEE